MGLFSFFLKNEASVNTKGVLSDYLGVGTTLKTEYGKFDGMVALKNNPTSNGYFGEAKYTSPSFSGFAMEWRGRAFDETSGQTMTSRMALKYSNKLNNRTGLYGILGTQTKFYKENSSSTTNATGFLGVDYGINKHLSSYAELEVNSPINKFNISFASFSHKIILLQN